jgi:hypothetical protein
VQVSETKETLENQIAADFRGQYMTSLTAEKGAALAP